MRPPESSRTQALAFQSIEETNHNAMGIYKDYRV